ncbi:hypothetical protein ACOBQX_19875 [Actinokineospora sp. G85]|uniref:hypothetical protein n=1 Tax=Actinokineospora sp. G85 TaxID=3406626 RepID=UPI003C70C6F0
MLKKIGVVTAGVAAGMVMLSGFATAQAADVQEHDDDFGQVGLVNLNNTDILHNVNANVGVCDNNINVLGVQVPVEDVANGLSVPILSPGESEAEGSTPSVCAAAGLVDGGTSQEN